MNLEIETRFVSHFRNKDKYVQVIKKMTRHDIDPITFIDELDGHSAAFFSWTKDASMYADQISFAEWVAKIVEEHQKKRAITSNLLP